ncbi:MAG: hypothetical protein D6802_06725, partial [Ardenticatenia bacterium]
MKRLRLSLLFALALLLFLAPTRFPAPSVTATEPVEVIVQAGSVDEAATLAALAGGDIVRELGIIDAVVVRIAPDRVEALRQTPGITSVWENTTVRIAARPADKDDDDDDDEKGETLHTPSDTLVVHPLHQAGITGRGVTVAIVDSGLAEFPKLKPKMKGRPEGAPNDGSLFYRNKKTGQFILYKDFVDPDAKKSQDPVGHGTHVAGIIANADVLDDDVADEKFAGIAPEANLVIARAIGADGAGTYADVIAAIDWIVSMK